MAKHTGMARFYYATCYSLKGLRAAFIGEPAFRYEVYGTLLLTPLALWVAQNAYQLVALLGVCLLVLGAELINTAIEAVVDRAGTEFNPLAGVAKDTGSAAVLLMLILACGVWAAVLWENFA